MPKNEPGLHSSSTKTQKEKNRRFQSSEFVIITRQLLGTAKITVSVSKKVAQKAVDRNRIKRIIKESTRLENGINQSLTFLVKKNIAGLKSYQVSKIIKDTLK